MIKTFVRQPGGFLLAHQKREGYSRQTQATDKEYAILLGHQQHSAQKHIFGVVR